MLRLTNECRDSSSRNCRAGNALGHSAFALTGVPHVSLLLRDMGVLTVLSPRELCKLRATQRRVFFIATPHNPGNGPPRIALVSVN